MSWRWLALCGREHPDGWVARARMSEEDGERDRWLVAWPASEERPAKQALRIDARAVDPAGPPATASLVLMPAGVGIAFDDPAVLGARRALMAGSPPRLVSTLLIDPSTFGGAITVPGAEATDDPFSRIVAARWVRVEAGLLAAAVPAPVGPSVERYGAGNPWPWDRFDAG